MVQSQPPDGNGGSSELKELLEFVKAGVITQFGWKRLKEIFREHRKDKSSGS